jgi:hypothetical protein
LPPLAGGNSLTLNILGDLIMDDGSAIVGCSVTMIDPNRGDGLAAGQIEASAGSPPHDGSGKCEINTPQPRVSGTFIDAGSGAACPHFGGAIGVTVDPGNGNLKTGPERIRVASEIDSSES